VGNATGFRQSCALLTAQEASRLARTPLTRQPSENSGSECRYGPSSGSSTGVQIEAKVDPDDAFAQADYPAWMQSIVKGPGFTVTPVSNFADGATMIHSSVFDAIAFRRGSTLVKIGVTPAASDAALRLTAQTVLNRLDASRPKP